MDKERYIQDCGPGRRKAIQMRFEGRVQDDVPRLHSMSSRIPGLLITAGENKRCVRASMKVPTNGRRADCLPYSHQSMATARLIISYVSDGGRIVANRKLA